MTDRFDVVVVGLGALGSAAAWILARSGARVLGLEQFELGHHRGASHDHARIIRRSYHTPGYVRLAGLAYRGLGGAGVGSGGAAGGDHRRPRPVPARVGHPARPLPGQPGGLRRALPVAGRRRGDAPLAGLPAGRRRGRALAGRRRHGPGRPRHPAHAAPCRRLRRHPARPHPGDGRPRPRRLGRGGHGRRHLPGRPPAALRRRLDRRPAGPARRRPPPGRHPGAVQLLPPGRPGRLRRRPLPGLDLDGRPQLLPLPDLALHDGTDVDIGPFALDRPSLTSARPEANYLV